MLCQQELPVEVLYNTLGRAFENYLVLELVVGVQIHKGHGGFFGPFPAVVETPAPRRPKNGSDALLAVVGRELHDLRSSVFDLFIDVSLQTT